MQDIVEKTLERLSIPYTYREHPAAHTMAEMEALHLQLSCIPIKNLLLEERKTGRLFLVCIKGDKRADFKNLAKQLGTERLEFADENRLRTVLGLKPGSVTPLGILNDESRSTTVVFDAAFRPQEAVGVHPNENTATIVLTFFDLLRIIDDHGTVRKTIPLS